MYYCFKNNIKNKPIELLTTCSNAQSSLLFVCVWGSCCVIRSKEVYLGIEFMHFELLLWSELPLSALTSRNSGF